MATKFYLHAAASTLSGTLPSTEQSSATSIKDVDSQSVNRSMDTNIGAGQTYLELATNATSSAQAYYFAKFVSAPLNIASLATSTWTYNFAAWEDSLNANFPISGTATLPRAVLYIWRPSTGAIVGTSFDGATAGAATEPAAASSERVCTTSFTGTAVSGMLEGDVLVFEVWFPITQADAVSHTARFYYDGATETATSGTVVSDHSSWISTTVNLVFSNLTKLYFHAANSALTGTLPTTEQSTLTADAVSADALSVNRSMNTTIGTSQTSIQIATTADTAAHNYYFTRFVSNPVNQTSIAANTWTYNFAASESSSSANFPCSSTNVLYVNCYVWRRSTGAKVGTILDGNSVSGYSEPSPASTEKVMHGTFAGAAVSGLTATDDVIVFEVWFQVTQAVATSFTDIVYFDGTTENLVANTTVSSHAAFIGTLELIAFMIPIYQTVFVEWEES